MDWITPPAVRSGDKIALVTPATVVSEKYVIGAEATLRSYGLEPVRMPHFLCGDDRRFAGDADGRLEDLLAAWSNPEYKAIYCGRGGYGSVQLISRIPLSLPRMNPKWVVGFSDVCALHALSLKTAVLSLHASMLKHLALYGQDSIANDILGILGGKRVNEQEGNIHPLQQCGTACGRLIGGNISVIGDLAGTPFDPYANIGDEPFILLLEDVGESLSRLQRRLWRLRLAGVMNKAQGIVVGLFTDCHPGLNFTTPEAMIADLLEEWGVTCPVAFNFPVGHDDCNVPLVIGATTTLEVNPAYCLLSQSF